MYGGAVVKLKPASRDKLCECIAAKEQSLLGSEFSNKKHPVAVYVLAVHANSMNAETVDLQNAPALEYFPGIPGTGETVTALRLEAHGASCQVSAVLGKEAKSIAVENPKILHTQVIAGSDVDLKVSLGSLMPRELLTLPHFCCNAGAVDFKSVVSQFAPMTSGPVAVGDAFANQAAAFRRKPIRAIRPHVIPGWAVGKDFH